MSVKNPERRYFVLVALGGILGSFIHVATSFVDFLGNKKMVSSWIPWYIMRPFIGAGLALVFYILLRGGIVSPHAVPSNDSTQKEIINDSHAAILGQDSIGVVADATATDKDESPPRMQDLPFNPFGIMAIALLAGMFSKQATDKLREVFEAMFNIKAETPREDPLHPANNYNSNSATDSNPDNIEEPVG